MSFQATITIPGSNNGQPGIFSMPTDHATVFRCTRADAPFKVKPDNGGDRDMNAGLGWGQPGGQEFIHLTFYNSLAQAINVSFWIGEEEFADDKNSVSNPVILTSDSKTFCKGFAAANIAGGASVTFYGIGGSGAGQAGALYSHRKAIVITNNDPGSDLELYDAAGTTRLATIFHLQAFYLETSDDLVLKNETAGAINCRVCEVFYPATT